MVCSSSPPWTSGPHSSQTTARSSHSAVRCKNGRSLVQFCYCSHAIRLPWKQPKAWESSPRQSSFLISHVCQRWGRAHRQIKWRLHDTTQPTSLWKLNHQWVAAKPTASSSVGKPHSKQSTDVPGKELVCKTNKVIRKFKTVPDSPMKQKGTMSDNIYRMSMCKRGLVNLVAHH